MSPHFNLKYTDINEDSHTQKIQWNNWTTDSLEMGAGGEIT